MTDEINAKIEEMKKKYLKRKLNKNNRNNLARGVNIVSFYSEFEKNRKKDKMHPSTKHYVVKVILHYKEGQDNKICDTLWYLGVPSIAYSSLMDYRIKNKIIDITGKTFRVNNINNRTYRWELIK